MQLLEGIFDKDGIHHITKKKFENCPKCSKNLFGTVKVNVKNVKTGLMQKVKTPVTTNTKNW